MIHLVQQMFLIFLENLILYKQLEKNLITAMSNKKENKLDLQKCGDQQRFLFFVNYSFVLNEKKSNRFSLPRLPLIFP